MASTRTGTLPSLQIRFTEASMRQAEADLAGVRNGMPRAISGAINKVVGKGKTEPRHAAAAARAGEHPA
jgi:hypothetical protein